VTAVPAPAFAFGAAQATKPAFSFGSAAVTTSTPAFGAAAATPKHSFIGNGNLTNNGSLNQSAIFTPKNDPKPMGLFSSIAASTLTTTPNTSFNFGTQPQQSGYNFGENKPTFGSFPAAPASAFTFGQSKIGTSSPAFGSTVPNGFGVRSPMFGSAQNVFGSSDGGNAFSVATNDARRKVLPRRRR
ncbi:hypothetical protein Ciccas_011754, partial [Cichlidogyrus casuarinus]